MKANAKYTALEILVACGVEKPEEKIGKMRVRIAGISGIVKPDHLIKIQAGTEKIDVVVGVDTFELKLEGDNEESVVSDEAKVVIEGKAKELNKLAQEVADKKAEKEEKTE
jgi:hypothetical protein